MLDDGDTVTDPWFTDGVGNTFVLDLSTIVELVSETELEYIWVLVIVGDELSDIDELEADTRFELSIARKGIKTFVNTS